MFGVAVCCLQIQRSRQPKVSNNRFASRTKENVVGLDVAMNDAARVRCRECGRDVEAKPNDLPLRELSELLKAPAK